MPLLGYQEGVAVDVIGEDPLLIEGLWQKMFPRTCQFGRRLIVLNPISGIDIPLWDIAGEVARMSLYRLLGGCCDRARPSSGCRDRRSGAELPVVLRGGLAGVPPPPRRRDPG
jgi:L-alanine-DL-glutamate epimerase-like enolase superfamily enzyme